MRSAKLPFLLVLALGAGAGYLAATGPAKVLGWFGPSAPAQVAATNEPARPAPQTSGACCFGDLTRGHAVSGQCAYPTDLRRRHGGPSLLGNVLAPRRRLGDRRLDRGARRKPRGNREDTRLTPLRCLRWRIGR